jgi:hypothetical protein
MTSKLLMWTLTGKVSQLGNGLRYKMGLEGNKTNHDHYLILLLIPSLEGSMLILRDNANARPVQERRPHHSLSGGQART